VFVLFLYSILDRWLEPNYRLIIIKPDNVPITIMVISVSSHLGFLPPGVGLNDDGSRRVARSWKGQG